MTIYELLNDRYDEGNKLAVSPFMFVTLGCGR